MSPRTFAGFDIDGVKKLAKELRNVADTAASLSPEVRRALSEGLSLTVGPQAARLVGMDGGWPETGVLSTIGSGAESMAGEVGARLAYLTQTQRLADLGVPVPQDVFQDASPPSAQDLYTRKLCEELGIEDEAWDTSQGLSFNDDRMTRVYEYDARLFREHPELQWAGMAKLAGGLVYAGMQDLHVLRKLGRDARRELLKDRFPQMPEELMAPLIEAGEGELEYFEDTFVDMQKQIFEDLAWQHAAYAEGGIETLRSLDEAGELPPGMIDAWEDIASGDPDRIMRGNKALLYREQKIVLQDDYEEMKNHHGPLGLAVTYMLGVTAESPVPSGRPFREVVDDVTINTPDTVGVDVDVGPIEFGIEIDTPGEIGIDMPLPTGNIADFDSRWEWIETDMLPRYQEMLEDPRLRDDLREEIDRPLKERAEDYRLVPIGYDPDDGVR